LAVGRSHLGKRDQFIKGDIADVPIGKKVASHSMREYGERKREKKGHFSTSVRRGGKSAADRGGRLLPPCTWLEKYTTEGGRGN